MTLAPVSCVVLTARAGLIRRSSRLHSRPYPQGPVFRSGSHAAGARKSSFFTDSARIMRAILFAIATNFGGFPDIILRSRRSFCRSDWRRFRSTAVVPRTGSCPKSRCPILVIRPNRCRPAVECSRRVRCQINLAPLHLAAFLLVLGEAAARTRLSQHLAFCTSGRVDFFQGRGHLRWNRRSICLSRHDRNPCTQTARRAPPALFPGHCGSNRHRQTYRKAAGVQSWQAIPELAGDDTEKMSDQRKWDAPRVPHEFDSGP